MNILLLGDIVGPSGRKVVIEELPTIIKKKKTDFVIILTPPESRNSKFSSIESPTSKKTVSLTLEFNKTYVSLINIQNTFSQQNNFIF